MQMGVPHRLSAGQLAIRAEIETVGLVPFQQHELDFACQGETGSVFLRGRVEDGTYVAFGDDQGMAGRDRIGIGKSPRERVLLQYLAIEMAEDAGIIGVDGVAGHGVILGDEPGSRNVWCGDRGALGALTRLFVGIGSARALRAIAFRSAVRLAFCVCRSRGFCLAGSCSCAARPCLSPRGLTRARLLRALALRAPLRGVQTRVASLSNRGCSTQLGNAIYKNTG